MDKNVVGKKKSPPDLFEQHVDRDITTSKKSQTSIAPFWLSAICPLLSSTDSASLHRTSTCSMPMTSAFSRSVVIGVDTRQCAAPATSTSRYSRRVAPCSFKTYIFKFMLRRSLSLTILIQRLI